MALHVNLYQVQTEQTTIFTQDFKPLVELGHKVIAKFRMKPYDSRHALIPIANSYFQLGTKCSTD